MNSKYSSFIGNTFENRQSGFDEKIAYKNLKEYDKGLYKPKSKNTTLEKLDFKDFSNTQVLDINQKQLEHHVNHGKLLNTRHSDFKPGEFADRNSYEATFSKKGYYNYDLEFILELFISHHNVHSFRDGNKRTALNLFLDLIHISTPFKIKNILNIQDAQLLYLEELISKEIFTQIILNEVVAKVVNRKVKCHLEHLIDRVEIVETDSQGNIAHSERKSSFTLSDIEKSQFFYQSLKKPYFQRDTNEWTVDRVEKFLSTFLDDGLIPAIILWESNEGDILIIDGAHRVSSLIAWINDDYGNSSFSNNNSHLEISKHINETIGNYEIIKSSTDLKYKPLKQILAKKSVAIQWVTGDYERVKESFIRINEQGVTLSNDEKKLIMNDSMPTSQVSRAILSHGSGQDSKFQSNDTLDIFNLFFSPTLIKDNVFYPMLGALDEDFLISKVFNVVNIIDQNYDLVVLTKKVKEFGEFTQNYLQMSNKVYFYGANQRYKKNSLLGMTLFIKEMMDDKQLLEIYLKNRSEFEKYLVDNESNVQDIARKKRQASNAFEDIAKYYTSVLNSIHMNNLAQIYIDFPYLVKDKMALSQKQMKIQESYRLFLSSIPKCKQCNGYIDGHPSETDSIHNCCKIALT